MEISPEERKVRKAEAGGSLPTSEQRQQGVQCVLINLEDLVFVLKLLAHSKRHFMFVLIVEYFAFCYRLTQKYLRFRLFLVTPASRLIYVINLGTTANRHEPIYYFYDSDTHISILTFRYLLPCGFSKISSDWSSD